MHLPIILISNYFCKLATPGGSRNTGDVLDEVFRRAVTTVTATAEADECLTAFASASEKELADTFDGLLERLEASFRGPGSAGALRPGLPGQQTPRRTPA